jgi:uncharacterized membrane protein
VSFKNLEASDNTQVRGMCKNKEKKKEKKKNMKIVKGKYFMQMRTFFVPIVERIMYQIHKKRRENREQSFESTILFFFAIFIDSLL